jgi:MinD-like ATPase involved in chromosome partitioning or flagellar assembly
MNQDISNWLSSEDAIDRFKQVLEQQSSFWISHLSSMPSNFQSLIVLRDWQGRFHLGVPTRSEQPTVEVAEYVAALQAAFTPLAHTNFAFYSGDMFDPDDLWVNSDYVSHTWGNHAISVRWIERQGKEKIWTQKPDLQSDMPHPLRTVFFGIKGGVGRSSALLATAYTLLQKGKKVLVLDVDFESPGVSSTLLAEDLRPDYGLLDWFALDALNPELANTLITQELLVERSGLDALATGNGTIWVAPSAGRNTQDYVGKLGRLYQDVNEQNYATRFLYLLNQLERALKPDVVLIDSRAGVDDTAALTLTQLDAQGLLFATHGRSTWTAYEHLFKHWLHFADLKDGGEDFREKLHVVSALAPVDDHYNKDFLDASYALFQDHLYEPLDSEAIEGFNYSANDDDAPHKPWTILWDDDLRFFDPIAKPAQLNPAVFNKAFSELVELIEFLISSHPSV